MLLEVVYRWCLVRAGNRRARSWCWSEVELRADGAAGQRGKKVQEGVSWNYCCGGNQEHAGPTIGRAGREEADRRGATDQTISSASV